MTYQFFQVLSFQIMDDEAAKLKMLFDPIHCLGWEKTASHQGMVRVRAYFPENFSLEEETLRLKNLFQDLRNYRTTTVGLPVQREGTPKFLPYQIVPGFWIFSPHQLNCVDPPEGEILVLQPGPAFGTGRHETTRLTAQLLLDLPRRPHSVLDVGTGSGILALIAKKIGCAEVVGVEIAPEARESANKNFELNGFPEIPLYERLEDVSSQFEVVLANLLTTTLIQLKDLLPLKVRAGAILIVSGIQKGEEEEFLGAYPDWKVHREILEGSWVGFHLSREISEASQ